MISLLQSIVDHLICWIETAVMTVLNLAIVGIAAGIQAVFDVLPSFPALTVPSVIVTGYAFIAYWFPMDWFLTNLVVFIALAITWFLISIPLRATRAIRGSE
jgi:hypothetical protein